jgi:hypothetical protein
MWDKIHDPKKKAIMYLAKEERLKKVAKQRPVEDKPG